LDKLKGKNQEPESAVRTWRPWIVLGRVVLSVGFLGSLLFYATTLSRTDETIIMYARYEPIMRGVIIHDFFAVFLLGYWLYLILFLHRLKRPWIPFLIFFSVMTFIPWILSGDSAVFLRFRRFALFKFGYPIALSTFSIWVIRDTIRRFRAGSSLRRNDAAKFPGGPNDRQA
jgi:hypothetical protein